MVAMKANYHSHTPRCHHAGGSEREYIEKAIEAGIKTLGFSDHVPMPFADGHQSGYRIRIEELGDYVRTLEALREEYRDRIHILIGFEAEYYPALFEDMLALIGKYDYDYLILGQHFLGNEEGEKPCGWAKDDEASLIRYVDQVSEAVRTGKFSYVAHPDNFNFTGDDEVYRRHMKRLCENCLKMGIPLEINMLGLREKRHYPTDKFFAIAAEVKNDVILGCDAHQTKDMADEQNIKEAYEFAARHGLHVLDELVLRDPRA